MLKITRVFCIMLSLVVAATMLFGCANTAQNNIDAPGTEPAVTENTSSEQTEPVDEPILSEDIIEDVPEESTEEKEEPVDWNDIEPANYEVMPELSISGEDRNSYIVSIVNSKLNGIDLSFLEYVGYDTAIEWAYSTSTGYSDYTAIDEAANLYSFIRYFDVPDETVREILVGLRNGREDDFTDEEIDLILSDDTEAVAAHFASETAIRKGDNLYSLYWIYSHPISDYISNGITPEDLESRVPYYNETPMSLEAKAAMKGKIEAYASGDYELTQAQAPAAEDNSGAEE